MNLEHLEFPKVGWGYMPPTDEVFRAFEFAQSRYDIKKSLEIGFHVGHSTSYQLEIFKDASIVGVSPENDGNFNDRIPDGMRRKMADIIEKKYNKRFKWLPGTTKENQKRLMSFDFQFDFALVDGHHSEGNTRIDLSTVVNLLKIPAFIIDNYEQKQIRKVCDEFPLQLIDKFSYSDNFKNKSRVNQLALFEVLDRNN